MCLRRLTIIVSLLVSAVVAVGCSGQDTSGPALGNQTSDGWKAGLDEQLVESLSQLSDADRAGALAQNVCPVSDKPLGTMGRPPKVTVEGRDVFLCCGGCEDALKEEPAKYLAKLKAK